MVIIMIIPRIHNEKNTGSFFTLPLVIKTFCADDPGERAVGLFRYFVPQASFMKVNSRKDAQIIFECRYDLDITDEAYTISASSLPIIVRYRDFGGARNAAATIAQLLKRGGASYLFPNTEIEDAPDAKMRMILLDPARNLIPMPRMKDLLIMIAMAKFNFVHLHLSDSEGYAIKSDVVHFPGHYGLQYTKDEVREIVRFASMLGIECIPEVEFPGHGTTLVEEYPDTRCVPDITSDVTPTKWNMCAGSEETYRVLELLYTELAELFPGKLIHVGTDEIDMKDHPELVPTWHCCSRCREMCEREGIDPDNVTEVFYYMTRRVYKIITGLGKRMMLWNDNIDIAKTPELPRDILIDFWRIAAPNRGPREGCTYERFLEEGFEVVNCHFVETYVERNRLTDEQLSKWTPHNVPEHDPKYNRQILGGGPCAWDDPITSGHFEWSLPSSIMLFGDRLWNAAEYGYDSEYGRACSRWMFGIKTPADFNMFEAFGIFQQPRNIDGRRMWGNKAATDLAPTDAVLAQLENDYSVGGRLATAYRRSIKWLNEKRAENPDFN